MQNTAEQIAFTNEVSATTLTTLVTENGFKETNHEVVIQWFLKNRDDIMTMLKDAKVRRSESSVLEMLHNQASLAGGLSFLLNVDDIADIMLTEQYYLGGTNTNIERVARAAALIILEEIKRCHA